MKSKTEEKKFIFLKNFSGQNTIIAINKLAEKTPLTQIYEQLTAIGEVNRDLHYDFIMNGKILDDTVSFEDIISAHKKSSQDHLCLIIRLHRASRNQINNINQNNSTFDSEMVSLYLKMVDVCDDSHVEFEKEAAETFLSTLLTLLYDKRERDAFLQGHRNYLFPDENLLSLVTIFLLEHPDFSITREVASLHKKNMRKDFPKYLDNLIRNTLTSTTFVKPTTSTSYAKTLGVLTSKKEPQKEKEKQKEPVTSKLSLNELEKKLTEPKLSQEDINDTPEGVQKLYISLATPMSEVIPGLYLGNEIAHAELIELIQTNASTFSFNLDCRYNQADISETKGYLHIPLSDIPDVVIKPETFFLGIDAIEKGLKTGNVLVNCQAGSARSVSMVVAYLIKHFDSETIKNSTPKELVDKAFTIVKDKRPCAFIGYQEKALTLFAETIKEIDNKKSEQARARLFIAELSTLTQVADGHFSKKSSENEEIAPAVTNLIGAIRNEILNEGQDHLTEKLTSENVNTLLTNPKSNAVIQFFADLFQSVLNRLSNFSIKK